MPYIGKLQFEWIDDSDETLMRLLNNLRYVVPSTGESFGIPAGYETDGASIPKCLWSTEGSPFTGKYRDASLIHDYLCSTEIVTWQKACAIFKEAMLEAGCTKFDAWKKSTAVYMFGPHWKKGS